MLPASAFEKGLLPGTSDAWPGRQLRPLAVEAKCRTEIA